MLHLSPAIRYYLYTGHTDMRKGFDSLCGIISSLMVLDALSGAVFVFINKKRNQVKLLLWEGDGLSLYYKRLEYPTFLHSNNLIRKISSRQKKSFNFYNRPKFHLSWPKRNTIYI